MAARIAVGLNTDGSNRELIESNEGDEDECLLWSPTTPGVRLHWKSEDAHGERNALNLKGYKWKGQETQDVVDRARHGEISCWAKQDKIAAAC